MSAFEFLFSFYGLLLGLALTEVIAGVSRAINQKARRPIGWLTPLLAVVLVLDLMTFWATAWRDLREVTFDASLLLSAGAGPMIYYFAAKQAFPDTDSDAGSLDDHFFQHRLWVLEQHLYPALSRGGADPGALADRGDLRGRDRLAPVAAAGGDMRPAPPLIQYWFSR